MNEGVFVRSNKLLIKEATAPIVANYTVDRTREILVDVYGTASSSTVSFKGITQAGNEVTKTGISDNDFAFSPTASVGSVLRFPVGGLKTFRVSVDAISGGNISVMIVEVG